MRIASSFWSRMYCSIIARTSLRVVEHEVERVEVAEAAGQVQPRQLAGDDEGHALFADAAVRTQRCVQTRQVVLRCRRADHSETLGHSDDVADAVRRQLEAFG